MDPNPLLSTIATASAALVAIVGGFLVSRVISLMTERSGLGQRLDDLNAQSEAALRRRDELEARLLNWDISDLVNDHEDTFAMGTEAIDIPAMLHEFGLDRTVEEVRLGVEAAHAKYLHARAQLEPAFAQGRPSVGLDGMAQAGAVTIPPGEEDIYGKVWQSLWEEHKPPRSHRGLPDVLMTGQVLSVL